MTWDRTCNPQRESGQLNHDLLVPSYTRVAPLQISREEKVGVQEESEELRDREKWENLDAARYSIVLYHPMSPLCKG